jgi:NH3-dependent NAD+ synthetase
VSISGGIDSSVTLALMKHAQQKKDSPLQRVIGTYLLFINIIFIILGQ